MKARVIKQYISEFPDPLLLKKGDGVHIDLSMDKHAGWKFGHTDDNQGWIPEAYLDIKGDTGTLIRGYDATELTLKEGQLLDIHDEESGWLWCKTEDEKFGWCPKEVVEQKMD